MRAGQLTERVQIFRPSAPLDGRKRTWTSLGSWYAQLRSSSGRRTIENGELFPDHTATFLVRASIPAEEGWRLRHNGGTLYTITIVETNRRLGMKTLTCEKVNE